MATKKRPTKPWEIEAHNKAERIRMANDWHANATDAQRKEAREEYANLPWMKAGRKMLKASDHVSSIVKKVKNKFEKGAQNIGKKARRAVKDTVRGLSNK